jgi:hypothetical protein
VRYRTNVFENGLKPKAVLIQFAKDLILKIKRNTRKLKRIVLRLAVLRKPKPKFGLDTDIMIGSSISCLKEGVGMTASH